MEETAACVRELHSFTHHPCMNQFQSKKAHGQHSEPVAKHLIYRRRNTPSYINSAEQSLLDMAGSGLKAHEACRETLGLATYFSIFDKNIHVPKWVAFTSCVD